MSETHLVGVTRVLEDAGLVSYAHVPTDRLAAKQQLGRAVHEATWYWDQDDLDPTSVRPEVEPYLNAWKRFRAEEHFVPTAGELLVASPSLKFRGRLDRIGSLRGRPALLDLKIVAQLQRGTGPQTAAYAHAAREMGIFDAGERFALQLDEDGGFQLQPYSDWNTDFGVFVCALTLYAWKHAH